MVYGHRIIWMVRDLEGKRLEDSCQEGLGRGMWIELPQSAHNLSLHMTHIFIQKKACFEEKLLENEWDTLACFVEICEPLSPVWQIVSSWLDSGYTFLAERPHKECCVLFNQNIKRHVISICLIQLEFEVATHHFGHLVQMNQQAEDRSLLCQLGNWAGYQGKQIAVTQ